MPTPVHRRPKMDWNCREVIDAKAVAPDEILTCEFCNTRIRWIHILVHDDYERPVDAGCCCASRLCLDYDAETAESEIKNRLGRLVRFANPAKWNRSASNSDNIWRWVRVHGDRHRLVVYQKDGSFGIYLHDAHHWGRYQSLAEAKIAAFQLVEEQKHESGYRLLMVTPN